MKQTITIEVDVPNGYEAVDFRNPKEGEHFINYQGYLSEQDEVPCAGPRLIVRRAFVWPSWLKCAAIAKDESGKWYAHSVTPMRASNGWHTTHGSTCRHIHSELFDISSFPDVPWDQSLRINPEYKGGEK